MPFSASTVCPDFPHSVDDVPSDDWTVEQVAQWVLLRNHKTTTEKYEEDIAAIKQRTEQAKEQIWKIHTESKQTNAAPGNENIAPKNNQFANIKDKVVNKVSNSIKEKSNNDLGKDSGPPQPLSTIHIEITQGPYSGRSFKLNPKPRFPCWVGRSQGKKFKERGLSLSEDLEVSTTHGKFTISSGKFFFTDTGSTNGTKVGDKELEANKPLELENGMKILLGQGVFVIRLS